MQSTKCVLRKRCTIDRPRMAGAASGQTVNVLPGSAPTKGRLLVATPPLDDPNFDRTVIFMLEHHDAGALGVVINRPTEEELDEPLDRWEDLQTTPAHIFAGGPVETDALIALALANTPLDDASEDLSPVVGRVASADLTADPAFVAGRVSAVRVFRGYAGWGPGQLEGEIMAGAWLVFDAEPDDVFATQPAQLWRTVLRRQGGRLGWLANAPDDLSAN